MQYGSGLNFDARHPVNRRNEEDWTDAQRARKGLGPWAGAKDTRMHPPFQAIEEFQAEHPCAPTPDAQVSSTPAKANEAQAFSTRSGRSPGRASPALTLARDPSILGPRMAQTLLRKRRDMVRGVAEVLNETVKAAVTEAVAPLQAMFIRNNLKGSDEISEGVAHALAVWLGPCVNTDTVESYRTVCDKRWPEFQGTQPVDYGRYLQKLQTPMAKAAQIVLYAMWRYESAGRRAEQIDSDITALKWMFAHNPPFEVDFFKLDILAKARSRYMRNEEEVVLYTMKTASKEASILPSEFLPTLQTTHYRNVRVSTGTNKDELIKYASCLALHLASNTGARLGHYAVSKKTQRNLIKAGQMLFWVGSPTQPEDTYEWVSGASTGLATYFFNMGSAGPTYPTRWVHVVHYQINTSKTVGSRKGQKDKTTKRQVRAVSITRASSLASTTLDMLVKWCIAMPLAKDDPLLTIYRTDLSGKRQDTKTVHVQRPGSSSYLEHMRRYLQYADVTAAIKTTVINGACGSLNPAHFTTRSVRRSFMELSGTLMTRTETCLLGQWSEDSLVPENVYKQDGVLVGALDRLTEENIASLDCSAARVKADLDERDRQYAFLKPGFEDPGHAPVRGAPAGSKGLVLGQKFPDRPEEVASGEAETYKEAGDTHVLSTLPPKKARKMPFSAAESGAPKPGQFGSSKGKSRQTNPENTIPEEWLEVSASRFTIGGPEGISPGRGVFLREGYFAVNGQIGLSQLGRVVIGTSVKDKTYSTCVGGGYVRDSKEEALTGDCWFSLVNCPTGLWDSTKTPPRLLRSDDANCHWKVQNEKVILYFTRDLHALDGPIELLRVYGSGYGYPPNHRKHMSRALAGHRLCVPPKGLAISPHIYKARGPRSSRGGPESSDRVVEIDAEDSDA